MLVSVVKTMCLAMVGRRKRRRPSMLAELLAGLLRGAFTARLPAPIVTPQQTANRSNI